MDKIRLGNDIEMRWSIFTRDGDNKVPYNLEGRALTLSVVNRTGESEIEFFAEGNIVTGVFRGRDQRILGKHGVILRENNGKDGMRTIDACDAFELVACTCEEALGSSGTIQLFHLTFDSTIGAITGTIDPILNYEAEQAEAERKANEIIRKANEEQRIDNEKQRNVNEILRNIAEEERKNAEQERIVNEDLRKADEAERKTNEESRLQSESERISSEEERLYAESIRVANENARIASEAKRKEAETARIEAEDKRIVSEKNRLSAESSRIANEDSRRANEDSRLSAEAKRVSAEAKRDSAELERVNAELERVNAESERVSNEEERQIAEEERKAKFASMVVQSIGDATDKVMSQKVVTEALKGKQDTLTAGNGISIEGNVISASVAEVVDKIVNAGYLFAGVATPSTNPGTPEAKVFYIANGKGTYSNFSGLEVTEDEVVILKYDTAWHKEATGIAVQKAVNDIFSKHLILNGFTEKDISTPNYELLDGYIEGGTVVTESSGYYKHTTPIPLIKNQAIVIYTNQARTTTPFWITDESGSYYIDSGVKSITDTRHASYCNIFIAKEDCYISVSIYTTPSQPYYIYLFKNGIYNTLMRVQSDRIEDLAVTANKLADKSVTKSKLADDVLSKIFPSIAYKREDFEDNKYFRLESGLKLSNASYACLGPLKIEDRNNIYVTLQNGNTTVIGNIVYFRKDNSFISGINIYKEIWVNKKLDNIPEDAYYIGFTTLATYMSSNVKMGSLVGTDRIADDAVTTDKLANEAVTTEKLADKAVTKSKLADDIIFSGKYEAFINQGNFNNNEYILLPEIHINKNILLTVTVDGASNIEFGVGHTDNPTFLYYEYGASFFRIEGNTISLFYYHNESELKPAVWSDTITIPLDNHTICTIISNIDTIEKTTVRIYNSKGDIQVFEINYSWGVGQPFIQNRGTETLFAKISFMPRDLNNDIWAFGDSYMSFTSSARWPKYMKDYGFTNWLSNNQPGLSPASGVTDFQNLLSLGYHPTYVVWFLGMNGNTQESKVDGEYVINDYQKTQLDNMIKLCVDNDIIPIIATMPTTPAVSGSTDDSGLSNEAGRLKIGYSKYVRSLPYRYIDFEKAVGTDEFGNWTEGLLSADKVHPSDKGAIVLVSQVLTDAPELSKCYN